MAEKTAQNTQDVKKKKKGLGKTTRTLLFVVLGVVIVLCIASGLLWFGSSRCDEECTFVFNNNIEQYVAEEQTFVSYEESDSSEFGAVFSVKGYLNSISVGDEGYEMEFTDFFDRSYVNGSQSVISFVVDGETCDESCQDSFSEIQSRKENLAVNELTTLTLNYGLKDLTLLEKIQLYAVKCMALLRGEMVDMSSYIEVASVENETQDKDDLVDSCASLTLDKSLVSTGIDVSDGVRALMENDSLAETDAGGVLDRFFSVGWFRCDTCSGECSGFNEGGIGLDYLFYPMLSAAIEDSDADEADDAEGVDFDPSLAIDILQKSYGSEKFSSFDEYLKFDGTINTESRSTLWGSEPVCMPYLLSKKAGKTDSMSAKTYKKMCYDVGKNFEYVMENYLETTLDDEYPMTEDMYFSYLDMLFSDYEKFESLELVAEENAMSGFMATGMDDYIYGYEVGDEYIVRAANWYTLLGIWDLVYRGDLEGKDSIAARHKARKVITTLLVKREAATDPAIKGKVDKVLEDVIEYVGGEERLSDIFDVDKTIYRNTMNIDERYLISLGDLLTVWLLDSDFYEDNLDVSVDQSVQDWFYARYMGEECGKLDKGIFINYNTDGECVQHSIGVRSTVTSILYLLIARDDVR